MIPTVINQIKGLIKPGSTIYVKPALDTSHVHLMVGNPQHMETMRILDVHVVRAGLVRQQDNLSPLDGILSKDFGKDVVAAIAKAVFGNAGHLHREVLH